MVARHDLPEKLRALPARLRQERRRRDLPRCAQGFGPYAARKLRRHGREHVATVERAAHLDEARTRAVDAKRAHALRPRHHSLEDSVVRPDEPMTARLE